MKKMILIALLTLASSSAFSESKIVGHVKSVHDGDTFTIDAEPKIRVRLSDVDCPELKQPGGVEARDRARQLLSPAGVDVFIVGSDRYGRIVGRVVLKDGGELNASLVREGLCWWYPAYSHRPELGGLEKEAKAKKIGLWAEKNPTPPWEWRKKKKRGR